VVLPALTALWFLPFVAPLCLYVAYTDLARMKITNRAVLSLAGVYAVVGLIAMPGWESYLWGFAQLGIVLIAGMVLNAAGTMGAGDAKFLSAAAPYVALGDLEFLLMLFMGTTIAAFVAHRIARATPLRQLAPDWESWTAGRRFPLGLALGPTLLAYLALAALNGA
jgi:prepilin peptidase CpaA